MSAPDLLEDFKQFLPESAAQAKAAAKAAEDAAAMNLAGVSQTPQPTLVRADQKLPPVGNFPPPSTGKEGKAKRPRPQATAPAVQMGEGSGARTSIGQVGNGNKRTKLSHVARTLPDDAPAVSPTLTPNLALPQPMPPSSTPVTQQTEVAFFDKVKKYLSNKQTFAEFLKLCNLFSQDLIDRNVLVHKVSNFIGTNVELMEFFKKFVAYTGPEEVIENRPRAPTGRVALSNCRGLGPSYRLLPKRVRYSNALFLIVFFFLLKIRLLMLFEFRWCVDVQSLLSLLC
jgi:paired amphipathic helix protein Sin3a